MADPVVRSLLPSNHDRIEHALEESLGSRITPLPVDRIRSVPLPLHCPVDFLAFAAWGDSTDLWNPAWPLATRRLIAHRALEDHAIKGSLALFERYLSYVGARLYRANTPHDYIMAGRTRSAVEDEAYLLRLPEIRLYPFAKPNKVRWALHFGHYFTQGRYLPAADGSRDRHETRAILVRDGVTTALRVVEMTIDADRAEWAMIPRPYKRGFILGPGQGQRQRFVVSPSAAQFVAGFRRVPNSPSRIVGGGGGSRALNPVLVRQPHRTPYAKAFASWRRTGRMFLSASVASDHVFDRIRLFEPGVLRSSQRKSFFSYSWARRQTHTMILAIEVRKPMQRRQLVLGGFLRGFARPHDGRHLEDALAAVRAASLPHEAILVDLETAFRDRFLAASGRTRPLPARILQQTSGSVVDPVSPERVPVVVPHLIRPTHPTLPAPTRPRAVSVGDGAVLAAGPGTMLVWGRP